MSSANASSDIERAEHLEYADSKGVKRVSIFNDGVQVSAATEETLQAVAGMNIPAHDEKIVDKTDPNEIIITYKLASVTVATKTIVTSGSVITITKA